MMLWPIGNFPHFGCCVQPIWSIFQMCHDQLIQIYHCLIFNFFMFSLIIRLPSVEKELIKVDMCLYQMFFHLFKIVSQWRPEPEERASHVYPPDIIDIFSV